MPLNNPWEYLVREDDDIAFASQLPQFGSRAFRDYSARSRPQVLRDYNARIGAMALRGEAPTLDFFDFVQSYPWQSKYLDRTPRERGGFSASLNPRLRFSNFRRR